MKIRQTNLLCTLVLAATTLAAVQPAPPLNEEGEIRSGAWQAWLDSPGGRLPFDLELKQATDGLTGFIFNGDSRIELPHIEQLDDEITIFIDHYDAKLFGKIIAHGTRIDGLWRKHGRGEAWSELPFHALATKRPRFPSLQKLNEQIAPDRIAGRWSITFSKSDGESVGIFQCDDEGVTTGTIMTPTGDYGHLAGRFDGQRLRLSTFDGAHAFLFEAKLKPDGTLAGDFWSRDTWHETWTARRNDSARLPDPFAATSCDKKLDLKKLVFKDLDGQTRSLADKMFDGKARIIEIFGSWCPNCHDAASYLAELDSRYADRGLSIVGLAFELTGDPKRDARQVRRFAKRHGASYPMLLAGVSDKETASRDLPFLDKLRSYPTTIFLHTDGRVEAVYTGFSGPATGPAYRNLKDSYERIIEKLLAAR